MTPFNKYFRVRIFSEKHRKLIPGASQAQGSSHIGGAFNQRTKGIKPKKSATKTVTEHRSASSGKRGRNSL